MSWHDLFAYIVILATATAIPGPDVAALIGTSLSSGLARSMIVLAGIMIGHAVWMILAVTGLAAVAQAMGAAFIVVKIAAVAYLLYLAWQLWNAPVEDGSAPAASHLKSGRSSIITGLLISLSNPKALVFFSAIAPTVLPIETLGIADAAFLVAINSLVFLIVLGGWAVLAAQARGFLRSAARRRGMNRASAVLIAGTGIAIASR
jgi:threonine/homoserine/homoserine lactone efflux protein